MVRSSLDQGVNLNVSIPKELREPIKRTCERLHLTPRQLVMQAVERELERIHQLRLEELIERYPPPIETRIPSNSPNESDLRSGGLGSSF
jgi:hypothetical protein